MKQNLQKSKPTTIELNSYLLGQIQFFYLFCWMWFTYCPGLPINCLKVNNQFTCKKNNQFTRTPLASPTQEKDPELTTNRA